MEFRNRSFWLLLLAFATLAVPVHADVGPDLRIISSHFDQDLAPGVKTNLTLVVSNLGAFPCAYKVTQQLVVSPPLSVEGLSANPIDKFCSPDTASFTFPIRVDPNAQVGSYPVTVATAYESEYRAAYSVSNTIYAYVNGAAELSAHVTSASPVTVYPSDEFSLGVTVENTGAYRADALSLGLSAPAGIEVKPSTQTQTSATLAPRSSVVKTFVLRASKDAPAQSYALQLTATFLGPDGKTASKVLPLTLTLSPKAKLDASDGNSVAYVDSRNNALHYTLTNTGSDRAKHVRVTLLPSFPFSTQGSVQFIETLEPGATEPLLFFVDVDSQGIPGTYSMDLSVSYENDAGDKFTDTIPVSTRVEFPSFYQAYLLNYWYVWMLVALVAVIMVFRRMRRKK